MQGCFDAEEAGASACEECVVQYWPEDVKACGDIDDETCAGLDACPACSGCRDAVLTYVRCLSGCDGVDCPAGGGTNGTFPESDVCQEQYAAFDSCVDPDNGGEGCENCVTSTWPPPPVNLTCQDVADDTCPALAQEGNCGCNGCDAETLDLLKCLGQCSVLECEGGTGTGAEAGQGTGDQRGAGQRQRRRGRAAARRLAAPPRGRPREAAAADLTRPGGGAAFAGRLPAGLLAAAKARA
jgi:hypothetical protein